MSSRKLTHSLLLILTALIWGIAFVAQSEGGDAVGPYSFNCIRSIMGAIILIPVIKILDKTGLSDRKPVTKKDKKTLLIGGTLYCQQYSAVGIIFWCFCRKSRISYCLLYFDCSNFGAFLKKKMRLEYMGRCWNYTYRTLFTLYEWRDIF